jgi:glycosyltransferase involved in cell wall biosynthesis
LNPNSEIGVCPSGRNRRSEGFWSASSGFNPAALPRNESVPWHSRNSAAPDAADSESCQPATSESGLKKASDSRVPISVVVPTKNEAANLERCLNAVDWASELIVVDSQSQDGTVETANRCGARVVQFFYKGGWPKKKGWALENIPFKNDWVLFLDADEVLMNGAREEIATAIGGDLKGYWINRQFMFLGKWLKHAYYPNWNLRLFLHRLGRFERLVAGDTASGDVEIHEHIIVNGQTGKLRTEIQHYAFPSVESFIEKHNRYSNWEARLQTESMSTKLDNKQVSLRRWLKRWSYSFPFRPFLRFWYIYVMQRGFLDGWEGYYFARLHACYEWMSVIKAYELKRDAHRYLGN